MIFTGTPFNKSNKIIVYELKTKSMCFDGTDENLNVFSTGNPWNKLTSKYT